MCARARVYACAYLSHANASTRVQVDFDTGDDLFTKFNTPIYVTLDSKFAALRNLEGATVCGDAMCSDACCPEGTCDTAPECVRKVTCEDEDGDETDTPGQTGEGEGEANERAAVVAELRRRAPSLAAAVGVALRPPPPSGTWRGPGNVTYLTNRNPDAPEGEDVAVMLTALRCSPLLLDPRFSLAKTRDHAAEETNLLAVALAAACGNVEVEMAARAAIRRHAAHVSPAVLRRAVMHSLRAAESAVEGSADVAEWTCRLSTAAVTVAEAARSTCNACRSR